jgi:tight adherence protein B
VTGLPPGLVYAGLGFAALMAFVLWGLAAMSRQDARASRIAAVIGPHLPARPPRPRALRKPLLEGAALQALAGLLGIRLDRVAEYRVPWWVVLVVALPLARILAGLIAVVVWDPLVYATPLLWIACVRAGFGWLDAQRRAALFRQFPDALGMLTRMVRVGIPVTESLRVIARESPQPTAREFQRIADRLSIGIPLDQALAETAQRNGVAEYNFFSTALALQAQTGGGLAETLDNLAEVIRKRIALRQRAYALASEARTSAAVLGGLPFATGLVLALINPDHVAVLFRDPDGQRILGLAIGMQCAGFLAMRQLIRKSLS